MKIWEITVAAQKKDFPQETFRWIDLGFCGIVGILENVTREVRILEGRDYKILGITVLEKREKMPNL